MPSQALPLDDGLLYQSKQDNHMLDSKLLLSPHKFRRLPFVYNDDVYIHNSRETKLTVLPGANFYQDDLKLVTDDVFSYMCSLAMEKCSKKSEKKKASCGGAAMRKRLLIKNFVAQMLAQEKENNSAALLNSNGREMDYSEDYQIMNSSMDVNDMPMDEEEEEDEEDEQEKEHDEMHEQGSAHNTHTSSNRDEQKDEDSLNSNCVQSSMHSSLSTAFCSPSTIHSMGAGFCYNQALPNPYESTSVSNMTSRCGMEQWADDFHTVPPTTKESYMQDDENDHCQQQEGLLYSLYPQYSSSSPPPTNCSLFSSDISVGALPDNLLDDISLWEVKKDMPMDCSVELNKSTTELASLVNMVPSMIKIGYCRSESLLSQENSYRRITDLDTNTPIWIRQTEQSVMDYNLKMDEEYTILDDREGSPRKRPISNYQDQFENGADNLCKLNLMMLTSPKRLKL